ncbi:hypothetical protein GCM10010495_77510 [Kitasatospora herbaricolor]|uniref:hypothetical protein n=1 Tax=Kitasatospora herbaricolor TaxID=68217 RepID=UPI001749A8FD|nr:hypothetical protein [Kitasatospora herbaricolor]MDQ0305541.1 hypothetical protein [Kitasatospora herbaricolor]GGV48242.1 hypothetical protein GCM10010495_77510 [Kitasatospora herbaricolor]
MLATERDRVLAAGLCPRLTDDYVDAEQSTAHSFKHGLSVADIRLKAGPARTGRRAERRRTRYRRMRSGAAIRRRLAEPNEQLAQFA